MRNLVTAHSGGRKDRGESLLVIVQRDPAFPGVEPKKTKPQRHEDTKKSKANKYVFIYTEPGIVLEMRSRGERSNLSERKRRLPLRFAPRNDMDRAPFPLRVNACEDNPLNMPCAPLHPPSVPFVSLCLRGSFLPSRRTFTLAIWRRHSVWTLSHSVTSNVGFR